jgi:succinate dehydrogenase assembly factor 1
MSRAVSGLQRDVLHLYRAALRAARRQADEGSRAALREYARSQFDAHRGVAKLDVQLIEHLLRKGHKQIKTLETSSGFAWAKAPPG